MRTLALNQNEPRSTKVQMSEAFITSVFLALSGGFQDAYTYFTRDGVFSNAQTGNVVLMSQHFMMGEWSEGLRYLFPLLAFAVGVFVAERIQGSFKYARKLHWRQSVLLCEMAILVFVGFLPENLNMAATVLVSFSCAMQVQTFRKVNGYAFASTMCIGNIRSGMESLCVYGKTKDKEKLSSFIRNNTRMMLEINAARVIQAITNITLDLSEEVEEVDMCKAIDDMMQDSREEGKAEGRTEGILFALTGLVRDGVLSIKDAAFRANMTESAFEAAMKKI